MESNLYCRTATSMAGSLPVSIVQIPLLIHALTFPFNRARQSKVSCWEFHEAVSTASTRCLINASIIKICHFELSIHYHKLSRSEIQQRHRAKG